MRLLKTSLTGQPDTLAYRTAVILVLLYAQLLVRVVQIPTTAVHLSHERVTIKLGGEPTTVPEPFASLLLQHISHRPNLQTVSSTGSPLQFPGGRAGRHLCAQTVKMRLRSVGIDLLGARNAALRELVQQAPAPIVASQLGYTTQIAIKHAGLVVQPTQQHAGSVACGSTAFPHPRSDRVAPDAKWRGCIAPINETAHDEGMTTRTAGARAWWHTAGTATGAAAQTCTFSLLVAISVFGAMIESSPAWWLGIFAWSGLALVSAGTVLSRSETFRNHLFVRQAGSAAVGAGVAAAVVGAIAVCALAITITSHSPIAALVLGLAGPATLVLLVRAR